MKNKLAFLDRRLKIIDDLLTKSDNKIIDYLYNNIEEFTSLTITDLANEIGISVATITRFVRKLGYDKLTDFKLAISKDVGSSISSQYGEIKSTDDVGIIATKVLSQNIESIQAIGENFKKEDLEEVVRHLNRARRVTFIGLGGSESVAQDAYHKFMRLGLMVEVVNDVHKQTIISSIGNENDVIFVISNEGANKELNSSLKIAKDNGMKIIAITQFYNSPLVNLANVSLFTMSYGYNVKPIPLISRIAAYSLIDIIYVTYCMTFNEDCDKKLEAIRKNINLLKKYDLN